MSEWVKIQYLSWMLNNIYCVPEEKRLPKTCLYHLIFIYINFWDKVIIRRWLRNFSILKLSSETHPQNMREGKTQNSPTCGGGGLIKKSVNNFFLWKNPNNVFRIIHIYWLRMADQENLQYEFFTFYLPDRGFGYCIGLGFTFVT